MRAGKLDRRIDIQEKTLGRDDFNEVTETWASVTGLASVPCEAKPARGVERWVASQFVAEVEILFFTRYFQGVTPLNRIVFEGKLYDILAVLELPRREGLAINAKTRAETGEDEEPGT